MDPFNAFVTLNGPTPQSKAVYGPKKGLDHCKISVYVAIFSNIGTKPDKPVFKAS